MADPEEPGPQGGESAATPPADAGSPQPAAAQPVTDGNAVRRSLTDPEQVEFQLELLWREMNEVHLLMDFVSGRNDKSLSALNDIPDPQAGVDLSVGTVPPMPWNKVIERICSIRFPLQGTSEKKSDDAAFLQMAKDRLNAIADPARGYTVAYTAMFSGVASTGTSMFSRLASRRRKARNGGTGQSRSDLQRAVSYSSAAYPNLAWDADNFRWLYSCFRRILIGLVVVTAFLYWDAALSNSVIQQIAKADGQIVDLFKSSTELKISDGFCVSSNNNQTVPCQRLQFLRLQETLARRDLAALSTDRWYLHPIGWGAHLFRPVEISEGAKSGCFDKKPAMAAANAPLSAEDQKGTETPAKTEAGSQDLIYCASFRPTALELTTVAVANVFNIYVVPMFFGVLGTIVGLVRGISIKVRESTLSPRDHMLSVMTIPVGAVAGLAVGLIFSSPSTVSETITGLPQSITLSAAAFAFLAGYGADSFFIMLDNLMKRIFALDAPASTK